MECFKDLITVKDNCADTDSKSGLLSNDIGISLEELNRINNSDYPSGELFFEAKFNFAAKQVWQDISAQLQGKYKINSLVDGARIGFNKSDKKIISGSGFRGLEIELCNSSSYLDFYVSSISLFIDYTGEVEIKVYDLIQGKEIDSITVDAIAGEVTTLLLNKTYKSDRKKLNIAFIYDSTGIDSFETTTTKNYCYGCAGNYTTLNSFLKARGVELTGDPLNKNLSLLSNVAGISLVYSLACNHTEWMCTIANLLAMPILFKYGMEVAEHALNASGRVNTKVRENANSWENRLAGYSAKYEQALGAVLQTIKLPNDSKCFECDTRSKHVVILP